MVIVAVVNLFVEEQVRFVEDFVVDKQLVAEGIVVDMAENIVADTIGDMAEEMFVDIAKAIVEKIFEGRNILSILVVDKLVVVD